MSVIPVTLQWEMFPAHCCQLNDPHGGPAPPLSVVGGVTGPDMARIALYRFSRPPGPYGYIYLYN